MNEDAFIQAILANPDDVATAQVYADWLEERGDPRGEYLRLEIERLSLPGKDERLQAIQGRLDALRQTLDKEWVMSAGLRRICTIEDLVYYLQQRIH